MFSSFSCVKAIYIEAVYYSASIYVEAVYYLASASKLARLVGRYKVLFFTSL